MRFLFKRRDGGQQSNVTGYWLIEWKRVFSIALLRFSPGARDCYHSHAFHSISWVLRGYLYEDRLTCRPPRWRDIPPWLHRWTRFKPSLKPIITTRDNLHRVHSHGVTWVLTLRGPWRSTWLEKRDDTLVTLTHGRKEVR